MQVYKRKKNESIQKQALTIIENESNYIKESMIKRKTLNIYEPNI